MSARALLTALISLLAPSPVARILLRLLGHQIGHRVKIGFSLIAVDTLVMGQGSHIGHLNFVRVNSIRLSRRAYIGRQNRISGPFEIELAPFAGIGNRNDISRAQAPVSYGRSVLRLGIWSKITSDHKVDCTVGVTFGNYSTLAGGGSQIWTHGYVHDESGLGRYRIDGPVEIGDNVYIGSMCFVSMDVRIAHGIIVGGGSAVAKDLRAPGLYVSAGLRLLPRPGLPEERSDLLPVPADLVCERVYAKKRLEG